MHASEVSTEFLLMGLISEEPASKTGFYNSGITIDRARTAVEALQERSRQADGSSLSSPAPELPFSRDAKRVFETAAEEARKLGHNYISPEHVVLALFSVGNVGAKQVIEKLGLTDGGKAIKDNARERLKGEGEVKEQRKKTVSGKEVTTKALDEFCRDLCEQARKKGMDPVIGRDKEVARVVQVLARKRKNNPVLLGEPGVGKTAIAEGLARAIVSGSLPDGSALPAFLEGKRVMALDLGLLIAGAKERGELESRVTNIIAEIRAAGNIVLMIDEVHMLVGAGSVSRSGGSGLDISNLLKPPLARGELQCIGATTLDDHRKYIERDAALERRFQPVHVAEPTVTEALQILHGLQDSYEKHHHCLYTPDAVEAAVTLSARYIADRQLPDKAIDLLDEAGSRARIAAHVARRDALSGGRPVADIVAPWLELQQVLEAKDEAIKEGLFEEAGLLREREVDMKVRLSGLPEEAPTVVTVTTADVEAVVSAWTGIPVQRMTQDDRERLSRMEPALKEKVIGQADAVGAVARAMRRARSGLKDPARPIAAMLFAGPTGVGKTELTKVLADQYFGDEAAMIRLDMSEYMERHTVAKLIGAPPGYVGYSEGGKLTEAVRRRPFSVVLMDEIEKAHPDVFNILLQILEDGRLSDSSGRVVSFKNTLIVMTSNVGSSVIAKGGGQLGFALPSEDGAEADRYARIRTLVLEELKAYFRPELLNRLDEIVVFKQLSTRDARTIAELLLNETRQRMATRGIGLQVTAPLMRLICQEGYNQEYGARPLRRAITRLVDDALSDAILGGQLAEGDVACMDVDAAGAVTVSAAQPGDVRILKSEIVDSSLLKKRADIIINA
ncbi:ATP-dependent Clp protease ATPase subunit [Coccomyxa subellipsoidea C-169]|uniref:ATP-dependent Clp protease ATPase subunit n=1 Tax=Coccomyxa subellipsoidea (strain C-169) TaxID=574566 RepID=I0Z9N1_COCSC|nr:ATP-dependent Clp protease ATPase subunit [Coccomyxa subellipsoidea C-169]EIE27350.1 ATP-dependent Clp protease ATPase subunit [Coccomyxa subellipsoidea C-169]|eukprot:XP_005651894.1 ATP-dependent Clp protease ATPase subunit [Coccomyxa subellipsoidea C-169]